MSDREFKKQVFKEPTQWLSGLCYRLRLTDDGRLTLASIPGLDRWVDLGGIGTPACLAIGECGQLHLIDAGEYRLYRYDPLAGRLERLPCTGGRGSEPGQFSTPARMVMDRHSLWVVDTGNGRIQAFARENLQLKYIIHNLAEPLDLAVGREGRLFVLDRGSRQIHCYGSNGRYQNRSFGAEQLGEPLRCATGQDGSLYVLDQHYDAFLRFSQDGDYLGQVGEFSRVAAGYKPSVFCVDTSGNFYVGDATAGGIHQFAADGSYLGPVPGFSAPVAELTASRSGDLYAAGAEGLALLTAGQGYSHQQGLYYSKWLDSGVPGCQWHRLALQTAVPPRTALGVYYYASDDAVLKERVDGILSDRQTSTQRKKELLDAEIPETAWVGPQRDPADMLFGEKQGRYLWLKLDLATFDNALTPSIASLKLYYPRISYLRYLPAIYQDDPFSRDFLERFLALFESISFDLETEISGLFRYFDPSATPPGFLEWLGSWLNRALEEQWPLDKKRRLVAEACQLYRLKGTPAGISGLVEIYTGKTPRILEYAALGGQLILGKELRLGISTLLVRTPVRGFSLGDDSILGRTALRGEASGPTDPFLPLAHRFSVMVELSAAERDRCQAGLIRLLEAEKPADTLCHLRIIDEAAGGVGAYLGINSRVDGYRGLKIGLDAVLGSNLAVLDNEEPCGKVERRSLVGKGTRLD